MDEEQLLVFMTREARLIQYYEEKLREKEIELVEANNAHRWAMFEAGKVAKSKIKKPRKTYTRKVVVRNNVENNGGDGPGGSSLPIHAPQDNT